MILLHMIMQNRRISVHLIQIRVQMICLARKKATILKMKFDFNVNNRLHALYCLIRCARKLVVTQQLHQDYHLLRFQLEIRVVKFRYTPSVTTRQTICAFHVLLYLAFMDLSPKDESFFCLSRVVYQAVDHAMYLESNQF